MLSRRPLLPGDVIAGRYKLIEALGNGAMGQVFVGENLVDRPARRHQGAQAAAPRRRAVPPPLSAGGRGGRRHRASQRRPLLRSRRRRSDVPRHGVRPGSDAVGGAAQADGSSRCAPSTSCVACAGRSKRRTRGRRPSRHQAVERHPRARRRDGDEPKLIDFGLAQVRRRRSATRITRTGEIIGTPQYMAPEQMRTSDVDARADVYALGCVLYQMIRRPLAVPGRRRRGDDLSAAAR